MGSAPVIGNERSGWTAGERVQEHADRQRDEALDDPLRETGRRPRQVPLETHLALEVGDGRHDHQPQAREAPLALGVGGRSRPLGWRPFVVSVPGPCS